MSPADFVAAPSSPRELGQRCGVCQTAIAESETVGPCPSCGAVHHADCWTENGGCATYGCERMPELVKEAAAMPQSYWGLEVKACPRCAKSINVAALRCRYCGTIFEGRSPDQARKRKPSSAAAYTIFAAGMFPLTAPIALVAGGIWALVRADEVKRMAGMQRVLLLLGLTASAAISAVLLVAALVHRSV